MKKEIGRNKVMKRVKKIIPAMLSLTLTAGLAGCGSRTGVESTETAEIDSVAVEADTPTRGSLTVSATYIGTVSPQEQVSVIPLVLGEVAEVNYEVGDYVEAGNVLVRIDDDVAKLQLESAEIAKKSAELSAQRTLGSTQDLSNISSNSNIAAIQNQISAAQRQYETALDNVDNSYQTKENLEESLEDINSSIDDLNKKYKSLKNLASSAKDSVEWDGDAWEWKTDLYERGSSASSASSNGVTLRDAVDMIEREDSLQSDFNDSVEGDFEGNSGERYEEPEATGINSYSIISIAAKGTLPAEEWDAHDNVKSTLKSMGYSASDIGSGALDTAAASLKAQIDTLKAQRDTLESNIDSMDTTINSAERSAANAGDTVGLYENNLQAAQDAYDIQNGQAYEDTKATLENQIAAANVGVESAQMQLENYVITAPISGQIEQKNVSEFGMVSAGNPVYVISNKDSMTITFYVSEAVKLQMAVGQTVTVERSGQNWTATITQIGESVNSRTGLFEIKASVEGSDLTNGVSVKVHADTARTTNALLIPYNAVYFSLCILCRE